MANSRKRSVCHIKIHNKQYHYPESPAWGCEAGDEVVNLSDSEFSGCDEDLPEFNKKLEKYVHPRPLSKALCSRGRLSLFFAGDDAVAAAAANSADGHSTPEVSSHRPRRCSNDATTVVGFGNFRHMKTCPSAIDFGKYRQVVSEDADDGGDGGNFNQFENIKKRLPIGGAEEIK